LTILKKILRQELILKLVEYELQYSELNF